jgi:hypothetical protein
VPVGEGGKPVDEPRPTTDRRNPSPCEVGGECVLTVGDPWVIGARLIVVIDGGGGACWWGYGAGVAAGRTGAVSSAAG